MKTLKLPLAFLIILCCLCVQNARANSYASTLDYSRLSNINIISVSAGFGLSYKKIPEPSKLKLQSATVDALKDVFKEYPDITVQSFVELNDYMENISPNVLSVDYTLTAGQQQVGDGQGLALSLTMTLRAVKDGKKTEIPAITPLTYPFVVSGSKEDYERSIGEAVKVLSKSLPIYIFCAHGEQRYTPECYNKHEPF